jgi:hypothetical protein
MVRRASALLVAMAGLGCQAPASALGTSRAQARAHADELIGALESRFGPTAREPTFEALRPKLVRAALAPSRVFKDEAAWTRSAGERRSVEFAGSRGGARYRMGVRAGAGAPEQPAEYRGVLTLQKLGEGEFEWTMSEELAVGRVRAEDLSRALSALFAQAQSRPEADARRLVSGALPRAAAAAGRLFGLEQLRLVPSADGATDLTLAARMDTRGLDQAFPRYARFLRKYVAPMRASALALDLSGKPWWELQSADGLTRLHLRVRGGDLAPLDGPALSMPQRLRVRASFSTKSGIFRVGFRGLEAEVTLVREPNRKAVDARFGREPDWQLPFLLQPFVRSPLRRPFEGEGARLGFGVRDGPGAQTTLTRDYRIAVKENWVVRWLGGLTSEAVGEFRREAEEEADRFVAETLAGLRADVLELLREP